MTSNEVLEDSLPIPTELQCMLCTRLLKEAVITPCCQTSFCDECTYRYCCRFWLYFIELCYGFNRQIRQSMLELYPLSMSCLLLHLMTLFLFTTFCCKLHIFVSRDSKFSSRTFVVSFISEIKKQQNLAFVIWQNCYLIPLDSIKFIFTNTMYGPFCQYDRDPLSIVRITCNCGYFKFNIYGEIFFLFLQGKSVKYPFK